MKKLLVLFGLIGFAAQTYCADVEWLTDVPTAVEQARRENKYVMVDFTGSDWCPWCIKLKQEVFDQPAFQVFAQENLVLVEIDFPHNKPQSPELKTANAKLAQKLGIEGFPSVILMDQTGKAIAKTGYMQGGPKAFLATLSKFPGMRPVQVAASDNVQPVEPPAAASKPAQAQAQRAPAPLAVTYSQLALKGISGAKNHRMALINSAPLMEGEKAAIKINGAFAVVICKQIRDDSVSVTVDGKPMELTMGGN